VDKSNPAQGLITHQLLYCRVGIGFHLQILANGSVWGVHEPSEYSMIYMPITLITLRGHITHFCVWVYLYIQNNYTQFTHIYYVNTNFYFGCDCD